MAPKRNKDPLNDPAAGLTEEQQAALQTSQRLQAAAKTKGVGVARCRPLTGTDWPDQRSLSSITVRCHHMTAGADGCSKSDVSRASNTNT